MFRRQQRCIWRPCRYRDGGASTAATTRSGDGCRGASAADGRRIAEFYFAQRQDREFLLDRGSGARSAAGRQHAASRCRLPPDRHSPGAGTLTIPLPPPDGSNDAMSLKYQGTFVRAARDCKVVNGQLAMKIGVQGRVIVGPAGGPGQIEVPLRLAVVDQTPSGSKTIVTKLVLIPVMVTSDDAGALFTHIEDNFTFPLPSSAELDNYVVYIGFDPIGAQNEERAKPRPAGQQAQHKPKPNRTRRRDNPLVIPGSRRFVTGSPAPQVGDCALQGAHVGDDGAGAGGEQFGAACPAWTAADKADRLHACRRRRGNARRRILRPRCRLRVSFAARRREQE